MTKLIALDDGHGKGTAGKRTPKFDNGDVMQENDFNRVVVNYLKIELEANGFNTLLTAPELGDVSLETRVSRANKAKADIFISVHANALKGVWGNWGGIETYHYYGSKEGKKLAQIVHNHLMQGTGGFNDRGVKDAGFYVIKYTKMPAILPECGFMDNKREALLLLSDNYRRETAKEIAQGVCEYYGVKYKKPVETPAILGKPQATAQQMADYLLKFEKSPKINTTALGLAELYIQEGLKEGVRGDIAFAQALKETGYFRYGGQVKPKQNNFAGLGATNGGSEGASFKSVLLGVRAQIQHLKGYATTDKLNQPVVDPRYDILKKAGYLGKAPNWGDLNGKWAVPGNQYGESITQIYNKIMQVPIKQKPQEFAVVLGKFTDKAKAEELAKMLKQLGKKVEVE